MQTSRLLRQSCRRLASRGASPAVTSKPTAPFSARILYRTIGVNHLWRSFQTSRIVQAVKKTTEAELKATEVKAAGQILRFTDALKNRLLDLQKEENDSELKLRITVDGGGCNGFLIKFDLDSKKASKQDVVFNLDGAKVVVDDISLDLLKGSTIDFEEELARSAFVVASNPNAKSACGCKVSFGVE